MSDLPLDPYKTLQVDSEAEDEVISAAYRRLARKYHPDVAPGAEAGARMLAINAAWETIGDPARRAAYDKGRRTPGLAGGVGRSAEPEPTAARRPASTNTKAPEPETVSRDWSSGRSSFGGGYDPSMRQADGEGAAGPPPGRPSGTVLNFGRYAAWSLGEIARTDLDYIEWLDRMPIGRTYRDELDAILRQTGRRRSAEAEATDRRGLFRRR